MAESAKILSPDKTVLIPIPEARCPMAETITAADVRNARSQYPGAAIVAYLNSSVEVKAEVDVCCTSANAVQVVNALPQEEVVFVPDKNLADWVARHTGKRIIPWAGSCCTHHAMKLADVEAAQALHPQAVFIAHPECRPEVCGRAQAVLSTSGMLRHVRSHEAAEFIIGTETGLLHRLRLENPGKRFYPLSERMVCASMKMNSLSAVLKSLQHLTHPVEIPEDVRQRAAHSLQAMFKLMSG
jgi:quinolinate synthase